MFTHPSNSEHVLWHQRLCWLVRVPTWEIRGVTLSSEVSGPPGSPDAELGHAAWDLQPKPDLLCGPLCASTASGLPRPLVKHRQQFFLHDLFGTNTVLFLSCEGRAQEAQASPGMRWLCCLWRGCPLRCGSESCPLSPEPRSRLCAERDPQPRPGTSLSSAFISQVGKYC